MFVWVEWTCRRCGDQHTARFDIVVQQGRYGVSPKLCNIYTSETIRIDDVAYNRDHKPAKTSKGGSKLMCPCNTKLGRILEVVRVYMTNYYSVKPDTLTAEVCSA